ncbi:hypothetical protein DH2020_000767 [Rehmannia glutinosa]|uniref:Uncharacterized protein n=1 Tax=Rehmannia glutinosa TaxID=99300 RepID=A0ABR0XXV0_REHGL
MDQESKKILLKRRLSRVGVELWNLTNENDDKKMIGIHYKELWGFNNQLATRAALTVETFRIAKDGLVKLIEEVDANLENRQIVITKSIEHNSLPSLSQLAPS